MEQTLIVKTTWRTWRDLEYSREESRRSAIRHTGPKKIRGATIERLRLIMWVNCKVFVLKSRAPATKTDLTRTRRLVPVVDIE
jgi:hypothetical protein